MFTQRLYRVAIWTLFWDAMLWRGAKRVVEIADPNMPSIKAPHEVCPTWCLRVLCLWSRHDCRAGNIRDRLPSGSSLGAERRSLREFGTLMIFSLQSFICCCLPLLIYRLLIGQCLSTHLCFEHFHRIVTQMQLTRSPCTKLVSHPLLYLSNLLCIRLTSFQVPDGTKDQRLLVT